jgi:scyllo-inositol 2-dehydrogenase (NADP+)
MIRVAVVGLGKMGLSHVAILGAHPEVELAGVCDGLSYLTRSLERHGGLKGYNDFDEMLRAERPDAVVIATTSKSHGALVEKAIAAGAHVFCEKPFVLDPVEGERLTELAERASIVTQVGYHYRFVAAFAEAARIVRSGALGRLHHVKAEAYGPVVLRPKGSTWRSDRSEGGGVVFDYASHAIDLVHAMIGPIQSVSGVIRNPVFSRDVDDEIYCSFHGSNGIGGQLSVNWSDESCRKMTTRISLWGENGTLKADRQECVVYLRNAVPSESTLNSGWTTLNTTELQEPPWYYLRGEEYSRQIDCFVQRVAAREVRGINDFRSALATDKVVAMINGTLAQPEGHREDSDGLFSWLKKGRLGGGA